MPSILSKDLKSRLLGTEWSFGYNCYEVGHSWTPSCTDAALDVSLTAAMNMLPLYAMLYTFSQLAVQKKYDIDATLETFKSTLRSSSFIFFNAYNAISIGCFLRQSLGRFYYRTLVCFPALAASYLAILIEKPARRQALAFYMLNLASEIVYRVLVTKGYFRPIKHGETLLFAASLSMWYKTIKENGFGRDPVSTVMKILIGRDEAPARASAGRRKLEMVAVDINDHTTSDDKSLNMDEMRTSSPESSIKYSRALPRLIRLLEQINWFYGKTLDSLGNNLTSTINYTIGNSLNTEPFQSKHETCPHRGANTCFRYILEPIPSRFLLGYAIQTTLKLVSKPVKLYLKPWKTLSDASRSRQSVKFGLFLASLVSVGRLTNCTLRRYSNSNSVSWHSPLAGLLAGMSMLWAPKSSLSMYVMWKAIEQRYLLAAKQGKVRLFEFTILSIYASSAATILYFFCLEPQFVRPSYVKVIDGMSNHRLHQINRLVLDVFGTGSSVGYEDFFPDLHPKYMSNQFKELVFNWLIQPGSM